MSGPAPFLQVSRLAVRFGTASPPVLSGVDLKVARGEYVSIIGHSGCGKSTLLNVVAGLLPATEGGVVLAGREVEGPGPDRAVVFQNHSLLPWLTCYGNVRLAVDRTVGRSMTRAEPHDWTLENLGLVRMLDARDKRPHEVSGGMKQRVGIARALSMRPAVLLLDEPFGALDALTRAHLQDGVMEIHARLGTTILMVTHDVDEAVLLSDRVVMLTNGPNAAIGEVLGVDLPRPRERLRLASDPQFLAAGEAVTARGERIGWDRVVLATGSRAVRLPLPGADLPGVFAYRTLADVAGMRRAAAGARAAVVIGGGLLGLEAAACLARRGLRVNVVHPLGWPMERQLDETAGGLLAAAMAREGRVSFVMRAGAAAIEGETCATGLRLADGRVVAADLVVMAVGVRPEATLAREAGLAMGARGVAVDGRMRTSDPRVLAVGECAEYAGAVCGLAAPALAMAEVAAATLSGDESAPGYAARADAAALKVSGVAVWSGGEVAPRDGEAITMRDPGAGHFRRLWLRGGRLVGCVLLGDAGDSAFYLDLIASGRAVTGAAARAALALGSAYTEDAPA